MFLIWELIGRLKTRMFDRKNRVVCVVLDGLLNFGLELRKGLHYINII